MNNTISHALYTVALNGVESIKSLSSAYKSVCFVNILLCITILCLNYSYRRDDYFAQIVILAVAIPMILTFLRIREIRKSAKELENTIIEAKELGATSDEL